MSLRLHNQRVRIASTIVFLAALWFIVFPWVYGQHSSAMDFNNWMVGGMIATFAAMRVTQPGSEPASWVNVLLALWVIGSPWIQGYAFEPGRLLNSVLVGVIVLLAAMVSAKAERHFVPAGFSTGEEEESY